MAASDSQISDYILDVKENADEEFKTEQIPETNEKADEIEDEDDEEQIIDNSPDKELVVEKVAKIKDYYEKFKTQKDQKKADRVFEKIKKEISTFKFIGHISLDIHFFLYYILLVDLLYIPPGQQIRDNIGRFLTNKWYYNNKY